MTAETSTTWRDGFAAGAAYKGDDPHNAAGRAYDEAHGALANEADLDALNEYGNAFVYGHQAAGIGFDGKELDWASAESWKAYRTAVDSRAARKADAVNRPWPLEPYVTTAALQRLLRREGVKVAQHELRELGGRAWDGGPNEHKWYEACDNYDVAYPDAAPEASWESVPVLTHEQARALLPYPTTASGIILPTDTSYVGLVPPRVTS
jgi:hypothetical protein